MIDAPILITGAHGQVGSALAAICAREGVAHVAVGRAEMDMAAPDQIAAVVAGRQWRSIVNCAAYTAVDRAESEAMLAFSVNAAGVAILAESTAQQGTALIHLSTDYVFDGKKDGPYEPGDALHPLSVYGASKAEGEERVRAASARHTIVRTAWVMSAGPANFLNTMVRLAGERDEVGVVGDQFGSPTLAADLAGALFHLATRSAGEGCILHYTNAGYASWYDVAGHIFRTMERLGHRIPRLRKISTGEYPTPVARPVNSRLVTSPLFGELGISPRTWQAALQEAVAECVERA